MASPKWITDKTAAEIGELSVQTFRNWRHLGKGPAYSKVGGGRSVRYKLTDVLRYFEGHRIDPDKKDQT
jgi:hypothetical protein